jgi:membrane associated rhomboid family serine protease
MTPWVKRLLLANTVMFIASLSLPYLTNLLALVPALILQRPWTLLTYMFLHGGLMHLLFNMIGLFFFGPRLEVRLGSRGFVLLYLISGLFGALLSFVFMPHAAVIGASGAVFGILLGFARYWPDEPIYIWAVLPVRARTLVIVLAVISIYFGISGGGGNIAHFAHLGGFVGGFIYLKLHERRARGWKPQPSRPTAMQRVADEIRADARRWEAIPVDRLHEINRGEVERIRQKITKYGVSSLSQGERAFMDRMTPRDIG